MNGLSVPEGVRSAVSIDGAVLLDTRAGRLVGLNPTAAAIWERLCAGAGTEQIAGELAARFDVGRERARADVLSLISALCERGLLKAATAS